MMLSDWHRGEPLGGVTAWSVVSLTHGIWARQIRYQKSRFSSQILLAPALAGKQQKIGLARDGEEKQGLNGPNAGAVWARSTYPQILWITLCVKIEKGALALAVTGLGGLFKKYR